MDGHSVGREAAGPGRCTPATVAIVVGAAIAMVRVIAAPVRHARDHDRLVAPRRQLLGLTRAWMRAHTMLCARLADGSHRGYRGAKLGTMYTTGCAGLMHLPVAHPSDFT